MTRERSLPTSEGAAKTGAGCEPASFSIADEKLEQAIEATRQALLGAVSKPLQRELAEQMKQLIGQRSPWQIARMEKERNLR